MISDIIIISLIVVFALIGMKRGIAITILNIAGIALTAFAAYYASSFLSDVIYDAFLKQSVAQNINRTIAQSGAAFAAQNCLDALPEWLSAIIVFITGIFGVSGHSPSSNIILPQPGEATAAQTIENSVKQLATGALDIILFVLLALVVYILVKLLIKRLRGLFKIPVVNEINRLLGGILGIIEGAALAFAAVNIFYAITGGSNQQLFENSQAFGSVFGFFCILD